MFEDFALRIISPTFESPLVDVVMELEPLRQLRLAGDTPTSVFFELKKIFHMLESLGSAGIEGNHTTLADYVESKIDTEAGASDQIKEIQNLENAMDYIEETLHKDDLITEFFICELHQIAVSDLEREGDETPGKYRSGNVRIARSVHLPPDVSTVSGYMQELVGFINRKDANKYDLLKMALAHHRFCWLHPFGNGNGRVVRLLSYAMMIKYGFNVQAGGRVLNPTAVFCNDRNEYYEMLSSADAGSDAGLEKWCIYVLSGILDELKKVDRLTNYDYLKNEILKPALVYSKAKKLVTTQEEALLSMALDKGEFKATDIDTVLSSLTKRQRSYQISKLLESNMIKPIRDNARTYSICFANNYLLRGVIYALEQKGFINSNSQKAS